MSKTPNDKRPSLHINIGMSIQLRWDNNTPVEYQTREISDTGLFILSGPDPFPELDTEVFVKLTDAQIDGETSWVRAQVIQVEKEGIAIQLLDL